MNYLILPNETDAPKLYPLIRLLHKFGVLEFTSYGSWHNNAVGQPKAYLNLPLLEKKEYGMANCLVIEYTTRSELANIWTK